jgi:hypothetical protein
MEESIFHPGTPAAGESTPAAGCLLSPPNAACCIAMSGQEDIKVGQKVVILGKRKGTVRFIGPTAFGPGDWVGIELDKATGTHDGAANGHRYFTCPQGHGVYVQRQGVLPSTSWQVRLYDSFYYPLSLPLLPFLSLSLSLGQWYF